MLNKSSSCKEIADTQASLYLLNMPAQFGNVRNSYIFINDANKKVKVRLKINLNKNKKKLKKLRRHRPGVVLGVVHSSR